MGGPERIRIHVRLVVSSQPTGLIADLICCSRLTDPRHRAYPARCHSLLAEGTRLGFDPVAFIDGRHTIADVNVVLVTEHRMGRMQDARSRYAVSGHAGLRHPAPRIELSAARPSAQGFESHGRKCTGAAKLVSPARPLISPYMTARHVGVVSRWPNETAWPVDMQRLLTCKSSASLCFVRSSNCTPKS